MINLRVIVNTLQLLKIFKIRKKKDRKGEKNFNIRVESHRR